DPGNQVEKALVLVAPLLKRRAPDRRRIVCFHQGIPPFYVCFFFKIAASCRKTLVKSAKLSGKKPKAAPEKEGHPNLVRMQAPLPLAHCPHSCLFAKGAL